MKNNWPIKKLGEVAEFLDNLRKPVTASDRIPGPYPYYGANGQQDSVNSYIFDDELVLLAEDGGYFGSKTRPVAYRVSGKCWVNNHAHVLKNKDGVSDVDFLGYSLMYYDVTPYISGTTRAKLNKSEAMKIPLKIPPLSTQKKIVERLDAIRKAQELCDAQISKTEELFESMLDNSFKDIKLKMQIDEVCKVIGGGTPSRSNKDFYTGDIPWITVKDLTSNEIEDSLEHVTLDAIKNSAANKVPENTVLVATRVGLGKMGITKRELCFNQDIKALICFPEIIPNYLLFFLLTKAEDIKKAGHGFTVRGINQEFLKRIKVPITSLTEQQKIVEKLEAVQNYKKLLLKQKSLLKELFDSVLDKSMKGELD